VSCSQGISLTVINLKFGGGGAYWTNGHFGAGTNTYPSRQFGAKISDLAAICGKSASGGDYLRRIEAQTLKWCEMEDEARGGMNTRSTKTSRAFTFFETTQAKRGKTLLARATIVRAWSICFLLS
jgi:hypothetical protein